MPWFCSTSREPANPAIAPERLNASSFARNELIPYADAALELSRMATIARPALELRKLLARYIPAISIIAESTNIQRWEFRSNLPKSIGLATFAGLNAGKNEAESSQVEVITANARVMTAR